MQTRGKCATIEQRSRAALKQLLQIAKRRETEVRKGRLVVRFLARRLLNVAVKDSEIALAMSCYLPELQDRVTQALQEEGYDAHDQVTLLPPSPSDRQINICLRH